MTDLNSFTKYQKKQPQLMKAYIEGEELPSNVSISEADKKNGSPKKGDMIAINPNNPDDMWLVAKKFFQDNYEKVKYPKPLKVEILNVKTHIPVQFQGIPVEMMDGYHTTTPCRKKIHEADVVILTDGNAKILKSK